MPCFLLGKDWNLIPVGLDLTSGPCGKHPYFTRVPYRAHSKSGIFTWLFATDGSKMAQTCVPEQLRQGEKAKRLSLSGVRLRTLLVRASSIELKVVRIRCHNALRRISV